MCVCVCNGVGVCMYLRSDMLVVGGVFCMCACVILYVCVCVFVCNGVYLYVWLVEDMRAPLQHSHMCMHACIHAYIINMHTNIHTHTHTQAHAASSSASAALGRRARPPSAGRRATHTGAMHNGQMQSDSTSPTLQAMPGDYAYVSVCVCFYIYIYIYICIYVYVHVSIDAYWTNSE